MKKNKISKNWINKQKRDPFVKQSKIYGYRSRSAFKLIEMNKKFKFINSTTYLLDLGSSPGGWSQVVAKEIKSGRILALDIIPMKAIDNVSFINKDMKDADMSKIIFGHFNRKVDVVISDMASNTTGNKNLDTYTTGGLCLEAMDLSLKTLADNGVFLSKLFMGSIFLKIMEKANKNFKKVIKYKPLSSRKESKELYIYCKGIKKI